MSILGDPCRGTLAAAKLPQMMKGLDQRLYGFKAVHGAALQFRLAAQPLDRRLISNNTAENYV